MNTFKHFTRLMGIREWRPRHYAAALYFCISMLVLTGVDSMPWWGVLLAIGNLALSARCVLGIPAGDDEE